MDLLEFGVFISSNLNIWIAAILISISFAAIVVYDDSRSKFLLVGVCTYLLLLTIQAWN